MIKDHLGNPYDTVKDMCAAYGISKTTFNSRKSSGLSLQDALTLPLRTYTIKDHIGNEFESIKAMCKFYNISEKNLRKKLKDGQTLAEIIEKSQKSSYGKEVTDHLGNTFPTLTHMCRQYGVARDTYKRRIELGKTIEEALAATRKPIIDHMGNTFPTITALCDFHNIPIDYYRRCLDKNISIENIVNNYDKKEAIDHNGVKYASYKEMCEAYNIPLARFSSRIKKGWTIKDALTKSVETHYITDCFGNQFPTIQNMCKHYGVSKENYKNRMKQGWTQIEALSIIPRINNHFTNQNLFDAYIIINHITNDYYECLIENHIVIRHYIDIVKDAERIMTTKQQYQTT